MTKERGAKIEAGFTGEKFGMHVSTAVARKYTLLILLNYTRRATGKNDQLCSQWKFELHRVLSRSYWVRAELGGLLLLGLRSRVKANLYSPEFHLLLVFRTRLRIPFLKPSPDTPRCITCLLGLLRREGLVSNLRGTCLPAYFSSLLLDWSLKSGLLVFEINYFNVEWQ